MDEKAKYRKDPLQKAIEELKNAPLINLEEEVEKIMIPLEEYKELLIAKGKAEAYDLMQNSNFRTGTIILKDRAELNE